MIIPESVPVFPMSQLHNLITEVTNRIMSIAGCPLTRIEFLILRELNLHKGMNQTTLARYIGLDRNNLSRICKILEKKNLIERTARDDDKRNYIISLSEYGSKIYARGNNAMEHYRKLTQKGHSPEEWKQFKKTLLAFFQTMVQIQSISDEELVPDKKLRKDFI